MFEHTDTDEAPWYVVGADVKRHARLNCIHHLLRTVPWKEIPDEHVELPDLRRGADYQPLPLEGARWVPEIYGSGATDTERGGGEGSPGQDRCSGRWPAGAPPPAPTRRRAPG